MAIFTGRTVSVDGVEYAVNIMELVRKAAVTDTDNSGRTLDGVMHRDIVGTFYNYSLKVLPYMLKHKEYDAFYDVITAPADSHRVVMPYGQEVLEFDAYVTNAEDKLQIRKGIFLWSMNSELTVNFIAMQPQRR